MRAGGRRGCSNSGGSPCSGPVEGREGDQHEHGDRGEAGPPASLRVATITTVTFACMREVIRGPRNPCPTGRQVLWPCSDRPTPLRAHPPRRR